MGNTDGVEGEIEAVDTEHFSLPFFLPFIMINQLIVLQFLKLLKELSPKF